MKKKDIIQLVKKAIKEVDQFGNRQGPSNFQTSAVTSAGKDPYTEKNEYPFSKRPKRTATGMMESRIDQSKVFDQSEIDRIIGEVREITDILEDTYNADVNYKEFRFDDGTGGFQFQWAHARNWGGRFGLSLNENGAHELSALSYYDKSSSGSENIRPNNPIILDIETWKDLDTSMLVEIWSQLKPMVIKNEAAAREALSREAKAQSDYYGSKADTGRIGYGLSSQPRRRNESVNEVRTSTISKKRAGAELKQKLKGKRSDGMGKYDGKIYGLDSDGKRVELKSLNDLNKFKEFELGDSVNEMLDFEKKPGDKIKPDNFKNNPKLQPGKKVLYGGISYEVEENDGFILKLKSVESGKTTTVNLNQFISRGAIKEKNMKNNVKEASNNPYYDAIEAKAEKMGVTTNSLIKKFLKGKSEKEVAQMGFQDIAKLAGITDVKEADTKTFVGVDSMASIKKDPRYGTLSGDTKMDIEKKLKTGGSVELEEENIGLADLEERGYEAGEKAAYTHGTLIGKLQNRPDKLAYNRGFIQGVKDELRSSLDEISYDDAKKKGLKSPDKADISKDKDISDYELKRGMAVQKAIDGQEKNEMYTNDIGKDDYTDDEGRMAKSQMYKTGKYAMKLHDMLDDMEQLPAWVQAKLTKASDYLSGVYHYLDYEFVRRDSNLMEHVDKHKKRDMLMEGAMKKFFEMFDEGKTDEEIVQDYARRGTTVPEPFVSKARRQYEGMKKMKLELEISEKEFRNSSEKMVNNAEEGMESPMEEKQLASRLK